MNHSQLKTFFLLFFFLCTINLLAETPQQKSKISYALRGTVTSLADGQPASFALLRIEEYDISTVCDIDGRFFIKSVPAGEVVLQVSCLGYNPEKKRFLLAQDQEVAIKLAVSSIALPEFEVMAKRTNRNKLVVNEAAIEYIQPTSLADILLLLPGNVYKENTMSSFGQISARQVGSDANSSLGVAVMTDGAPVVEDAMRTQMVGITGSTGSSSGDTEIKSRSGLNQGVDMRYISTDHIQKVEFTRGISSAQYGNLSSGMIQVQSKYGVTPLRVRAKVDLKNKLAYVGKGFKLSEKAGTLHLGADYLHSIDDVREEMDKFSRITAQAYYNNQFRWGDIRLDLDGKLSQTITANKMKKDELTYEYNESYEASYSKTALLLKGNLSLGKSWLDRLEMILSSDFVSDRITRHKMVISGSGPLNVPLAKEEGEHEGMYLPAKYYSDFYVDNKPVNLFTQLNAVSRLQWSEAFNTNFFYGLEYRRSKNRGEGAVIQDETRPPFPYDNSYMRPRPNYRIPALSIGATYLQSELLYNWGSQLLRLSLGGRLTEMFNLADDYALSGKLLAEPRANLSFIFGKRFKNTFRVGYGEENRLPTLDYLYPEKLYKDFYMLNAYTNNPDYRRLITYTNIYDICNKEIRENRNRKLEAGWDAEFLGFELSLTAFYEKSGTGFEYFKVYSPLSYDLYRTLKPGVQIDHPLQKADYIKERYSVFTTSSRAMNSKKVIKRGLEYRMVFPEIKPLYTHVELNGAYYRTNYGSTLPVYYYPNKMVADVVYPYVGIYQTNPQNEYRRLNSNIWFNTHIPKFKLIFTNFIQLVWLSTEQYKDLHQKYPAQYMDLQGTVHSVTAADIEKINSDDMVFRLLKRTILPIEYARNAKPVSLLWNIKATKEFNKYAKLSFFVNGIIDINPKYTTGGKQTDRDWTDPYFGVELFLNFSL